MRASASPFLLPLVMTTALCACSTPPPEPGEDAGTIGACTLPYVGDPNAPMEMDIIALGINGKLKTLSDGSDVTLVTPPQEGRVIFAGVHARNVNPCAVRIAGALRDPLSKSLSIEQRIVNLQVTSDGYAQSDPGDIATFANIAACPNHWSDQDLMDVTYELTVSLTDVADHHATKVLQVTPRCNEPGQIGACRCKCDADYVLGMPCAGLPVDAGVDAP